MMVTLWALWKARRDVIHESILHSPFATCCFITRFIQELEADSIRDAPRAPQPPTRGASWIPPPRGDEKGNVDGALSKERRRRAAAAIFRSEEGRQFLGASALVINGAMEPPTIQAIACIVCRDAL